MRRPAHAGYFTGFAASGTISLFSSGLRGGGSVRAMASRRCASAIVNVTSVGGIVVSVPPAVCGEGTPLQGSLPYTSCRRDPL